MGVDLLVFLPKPLSLMISSSVMGFVLTFVALLLACGGLYSFDSVSISLSHWGFSEIGTSF